MNHTHGSSELTGEDVGSVADEPVAPVEERALACAGVWAEQRHEGLDEAEQCGERAEQRVSRGGAGHPAAHLHHYQHRPGHRQQPHHQHEEPVPLPTILYQFFSLHYAYIN